MAYDRYDHDLGRYVTIGDDGVAIGHTRTFTPPGWNRDCPVSSKIDDHTRRCNVCGNVYNAAYGTCPGPTCPSNQR